MVDPGLPVIGVGRSRERYHAPSRADPTTVSDVALPPAARSKQHAGYKAERAQDDSRRYTAEYKPDHGAYSKPHRPADCDSHHLLLEQSQS